MKKGILKGILAVACIGMVLTSCGGESKQVEPKAEKVAVNAVENAKMVMNIEGMTCAVGCAKSIEHELKNTAGVTVAAVDFENKKAEVSFDNTLITEGELATLVNEYKEGIYSATIAKN